mmetsp:Transcript_48129/g.80973  ORF Transcript_48129/g.80973 Transcript_48129/m.80973 type:complete len:231 (-) Transcript_48129:22-714(-)
MVHDGEGLVMNAGGTGAWDLSLLNLAPAGVPVAAAAVSGVGRTGGRGSGSVTPQLPVALLPDRGQPLFAPPPALGALLRRHFRGVRCHNAPLGVVAAAAVAGPRRGAEVVRGALVPPHGMRDHLRLVAPLALVCEAIALAQQAGGAQPPVHEFMDLAAHPAPALVRSKADGAGGVDGDVAPTRGALPDTALANELDAAVAVCDGGFLPGTAAGHLRLLRHVLIADGTLEL